MPMLRSLVALVLPFLLLLASCSTPAKTARVAPPMLEFRAEAQDDELDAVGVASYTIEGKLLPFLPGKRFLIEQAWVEDISAGRKGVHFVVYPEQQDDFRRWTGEFAGRRIAIIHRGQVLSAPVIRVALPGEGVISGGARGMSENQAASLVRDLNRDGGPR